MNTYTKSAGKIFMRNNTYIKFENLCQKIKGYVGTKRLMEEGFSNRQIAVLAKEGYLEKICHGYYWIMGEQDKPKDYKCIEVCLSDSKAIVCMESALYYQGQIEEEPECLSVATERTDRSLLKMNFPVNRHYFLGKNFEIGMKQTKTEFGIYNIYDIERSICDIVRLGIDDFGISDEMCRNKRLMKYAELLRVKGLH